MYWKRSNPNRNGHRRDKVGPKTSCIKNVKIKIIKIRTGCQYIGYFYYSENLNWAARKPKLGRVANKQRKQDLWSRIKNKIPFSLWVFGCDVPGALLFLIVIIRKMHDFLSFYIVVRKCEEWKEEAFWWSVPATLTSLRHCSWACGEILPCWFKV